MNIIEKLQKLVQIPSVSYNEEEVARWIFDYLKGKGIETEMRGWNTQCRIPGRDSSRAVIFNGHTDTVAAGELSLWKHPPSGPGAGVVEDGKLYGLGSSDMKAALAAFMEVAEKYHDTVPPVDLFFCFVTEEEVSGRGSDEYVQYFSSEWHGKYDDVICIVGEPTSFQYIELGNRGVRHFELNVEGVACHAAQAAGKTTNAPEIAVEAIKRVDALKADWLMRFQHEKLGLPAVTLTAMNSSESSSNAVPSHVRLLWDIRTTPDLHDKVELLLKESLSELGKVSEARPPCPFAFCPPESTLVQAFSKAFPVVEQRIARGGNDCGAFISAGIPAVTFGPGKKEVIHQVNEYAPIAELEVACDRYSAVIEAYAG